MRIITVKISGLKSIVLYVFLGYHDKYPRICSYAVAVHEFGKRLTNGTDDILFNKLGYLNVNDYKNSYPGKFEKNKNKHTTQIVNRTGIPNMNRGDFIQDLNIGDVTEYLNITASDLWHDILCSNTLCTVPTIDEVSGVYGYDEVEYKDLWFCSDWSDNDGRSIDSSNV